MLGITRTTIEATVSFSIGRKTNRLILSEHLIQILYLFKQDDRLSSLLILTDTIHPTITSNLQHLQDFLQESKFNHTISSRCTTSTQRWEIFPLERSSTDRSLAHARRKVPASQLMVACPRILPSAPRMRAKDWKSTSTFATVASFSKTPIHSMRLPSSLSLFNIFARYKGITKRFMILVTFGKHWTDSDPLKTAQSALIRRVAKMIQTFPGLKSVEIGFDMHKKNWAQLKNAAYFYQLEFPGWTFHHKVAKGAWEKLETRSALDRRLVGYRFALQSNKEL